MRRHPGPFEVKLKHSRVRTAELDLDQSESSSGLSSPLGLLPLELAASAMRPTPPALHNAAGGLEGQAARSVPVSPWKRAQFMRARLRVLGRHGEEGEPPVKAPLRNFDCPNYERCLGLAAALDWQSFTCKHCSGEVNQQLLWRAHHTLKKDVSLAHLCDLPPLIEDDNSADQHAELGVVNLVPLKAEKLP